MPNKSVQIFLLTILLAALIPTILVWSPFFFQFEEVFGVPVAKGGMSTVIANYDGPLYIVVAKSLYNNEFIRNTFSFPLPVQYYAAHFPLYPLLIRLFAPILGYPYSMIFVTLISSVLAFFFFYKVATLVLKEKEALFFTLVFSILPARWLIVRSVGSPEPLFITTILASVYYFSQKKYWWAGIFGALAQATKSPGIILFVAYIVTVLQPTLRTLATSSFSSWIRKIEWKALPIFLIPLSLIGIFATYKLTFNDFLAYFNSGDNIHLMSLPFQIFDSSQAWVGTFWLEEVIFVYILIAIGVINLSKLKNKIFFWFSLLFFLTILFVSHRDIVRYSLPIAPFVLLGFKDTIQKREFKFVLALIIIPIYLYTITYISGNTMPISDWAPLL